MNAFCRKIAYAAALSIFTLAALHFTHRQGAAAEVLGGVYGAGGTLTKVTMATPLGSGRNAELQSAVERNLRILAFVDYVDPNSVPGGAAVSSPSAQGIDFKRFFAAQVNLLITTSWQGSDAVELRAFEVGEGRFLFGNRYNVPGGSEGTADVADKFCDDLLEAVIGKGVFFKSTMAFIKSDGPNKKDVWAVKPNGRNLRKLTDMRGEALSPAWSPDGNFVVFTHIEPRSHALGVYSTASKTTQRIKFPGNTVIGPCFMPDNRVAVSLTDGRNPSIFLLGHSFQKERKLDESTAIDVSPSIDESGRLMAFTSNRLGGPQIFLKDLSSGSVRRVSMNGNYNTDPSISPDGTQVVFARLMGDGHRIFAMDLRTGQERQITQGPGSDEEPAFAPDGYFVAFMSTRSGQKKIYFTTRFGGQATLLPTGSGDAAFPAWGGKTK